MQEEQKKQCVQKRGDSGGLENLLIIMSWASASRGLDSGRKEGEVRAGA